MKKGQDLYSVRQKKNQIRSSFIRPGYNGTGIVDNFFFPCSLD